ncbi:putative bacteriophage coat protein [Yersinia kristensenii]|uniref:Putative bacteriophage coat protein n=1 Tax=Yersinia kristensenii TaxID=28152 RepID=A0A0T9KZ23_YERKR|nr:hypothetical protein [Yersinia kristensenii]CNE42228.1 putative bacteriophage coat protein [Yersinia kristensenii]
MGNAFDFELTATDQASDSIQRIEDAVKNLIPDLDKTRDGLKLGGQESVEGIDDLNTRLKGMGQFAREGVQFVGDMVPPLKMVGEIGSKALKFGALGAVGYIGVKAAQGLSAAADSAYSLDVAAKNAGMSVEEFSRVSGAMQILGVDSNSARQSVEGLYKTFNDPLWARNDTTQALLAQNGIVIERLKDGTADVYKTLDNVAKIFPTLSPQTQKTLADALGLDANLLALMREGVRYKELLTKSDTFGLTVDPKTNEQLVELKTQLNEVSAAFDGLMTKQKIWAAQKLLPSEKTIKGGVAAQLKDMKMRENDNDNSFAHGDKQKDILHRARVDNKFKDTLSFKEKTYLTFGYPDKDFTKKLNEHYGEAWEEQEKKRLEEERRKAAAPVNSPYLLAPSASSGPKSGQDALGIRNNNPGNLRAAPNATGKNGGFSTFNNHHDGISALSRQLQLYGDRGNNTLSGILHTYAPKTENITQGYIDAVSGATGVNPYERLDLHSPEVLKKLVTTIIKHENGYQPYSAEDIDSGVNNSINDDRWKGLRDPNILLSQRQSLSSDNADKKQPVNENGVRTPDVLLPPPQAPQLLPPTGINKEIADKKNPTPVLLPQQPINSGHENTNVMESIIPNKPDSILNPTNNSERDISDITRGIGEEKTEIELTLISDKTGERQKVSVQKGAKISTSMSYPA